MSRHSALSLFQQVLKRLVDEVMKAACFEAKLPVGRTNSDNHAGFS
jgi:hypothetical protein